MRTVTKIEEDKDGHRRVFHAILTSGRLAMAEVRAMWTHELEEPCEIEGCERRNPNG